MEKNEKIEKLKKIFTDFTENLFFNNNYQRYFEIKLKRKYLFELQTIKVNYFKII